MARTARRGREEGQAVPLVLAVVALIVIVLLTLIPLARASQERAAARTAADAAALAGAAEGEAAAREVARANSAEVVSWQAEGLDVWVVVELGAARAEAKARRSR